MCYREGKGGKERGEGAADVVLPLCGYIVVLWARGEGRYVWQGQGDRGDRNEV